jgi:predicted lipoprotein with Yx(FWY)xxD motif
MRNHKWTIAGCALSGLALAACGSGAGTAASASSVTVTLKSSSTSIGTVLASARGRTLYWFALDTPAKSRCTGACASAWPPVTGRPRLAAGAAVTGRLGTIKRPGGEVQVTWNGHPLYTYAGDSAGGQANGNGVVGFGGLWHAVTLPGAASH